VNDLRVPYGNRLEALKDTAKDRTASASMTSGACAFAGRTMMRWTWKLWTIT